VDTSCVSATWWHDSSPWLLGVLLKPPEISFALWVICLQKLAVEALITLNANALWMWDWATELHGGIALQFTYNLLWLYYCVPVSPTLWGASA
jgi:hypothetical protein